MFKNRAELITEFDLDENISDQDLLYFLQERSREQVEVANQVYLLKKEQQEIKQQQQQAIENLTVTVDGMVFDANEKSRMRMLSAINASERLGATETSWKLTNNQVQQVTLVQLQQAHDLAILAIGGVVLDE